MKSGRENREPDGVCKYMCWGSTCVCPLVVFCCFLSFYLPLFLFRLFCLFMSVRLSVSVSQSPSVIFCVSLFRRFLSFYLRLFNSVSVCPSVHLRHPFTVSFFLSLCLSVCLCKYMCGDSAGVYLVLFFSVVFFCLFISLFNYVFLLPSVSPRLPKPSLIFFSHSVCLCGAAREFVFLRSFLSFSCVLSSFFFILFTLFDCLPPSPSFRLSLL